MLDRIGGVYLFAVMIIFIACHLSVCSSPVKARVASGAGKRSSRKAEGGERTYSRSSSSSSRSSSHSSGESESDLIFKRFEGLKKAPGSSPQTMSLRGSQDWHPKEVSAPKSLPLHRTEESESESETASQDSTSRGHSDADESKDYGGADSSPTQGGELCADDARNLVSGKDGDRLLVSGRGFNSVSGDMKLMGSLKRLDLSNNSLPDVGGVRLINGVTWLQASHNRISSLRSVAGMNELRFLGLAHNEIRSIDFLGDCLELRCLILNNNNIKDVSGLEETLGKISNIETLILSHNSIASMPSLRSARTLKKLSVSHNKLSSFPDMAGCNFVQEIRVGSNMISKLPESLGYLSQLKLLDCGNNRIATLADISCLRTCRSLFSLNLAGNPVCQVEGYKEAVQDMVVGLRILDGRRVVPKKRFGEKRDKDCREVYVSNLPYSATEDTVRQLFAPLGRNAVLRVQMLVKHDKKFDQERSKGSAFVRMRTPEVAADAVRELAGKHCTGEGADGTRCIRPLKIKPSWRDVHGKTARGLPVDNAVEADMHDDV